MSSSPNDQIEKDRQDVEEFNRRLLEKDTQKSSSNSLDTVDDASKRLTAQQKRELVPELRELSRQVYLEKRQKKQIELLQRELEDEQMVFDEAETTYATELWLLEDMSFAIVHCVKMKIGSEDTGYVTEYRAFKKPLEISEDLFFSPESLIEELESMCVPLWEHEATIYEL